MPTLDFKGKQIVYAHHLTVPARTLEPDAPKSLPPEDQKPSLDDNLIIHGDNLHALKALMPRYAGRVHCIYIDPPYNTGNEGWAYNDNVNSPLMQEWLKGKSPVDGEDLERHDKWLCMMWPRLHLLRELLAEDGSIWVSIDDNEVHYLKAIMDEVFGRKNFVANVVWQKSYTSNQTAKFISDTHDHILLYTLNPERFSFGKIERTEEQKTSFRNPDGDPRGPWKAENLSAGKFYAAGQFEITGPTGKKFFPPKNRYWRCNQETYQSWLDDGRITFGAKGEGRPMLKKYLSEMNSGLTPNTWWEHEEVGSNKLASTDLKKLFPGKEVFGNPKPEMLLTRILQLATSKDAIILDSFAGSGTTAQAVLALNAEDGGNRKFILVECEDYADTITAERVRRVINGVPTAKDEYLKNGLGGSFTYCTLGEEISPEKMLIGENLPDYDTLARHLVYTATGQAPTTIRKARSKDGFFHETDDRLFYLIYEPDLAFLRSAESALNGDRAERIAKQAKAKQKTAVVFATHKFMGQKELTGMGIVFCGLPYEVLSG